jgi:CBS domain-containing protein
MSIREILASKGTGGVYSISPESSIVEAITIMSKHNIGSLVAKQGEQMVGLLTDRHIVRALTKAGGNLSQSLVRDAMETKPVVGHLEDSVDQVRRQLTENHISHLPVVDDSGVVVDIISFYDVARTVLSNVEFENKLLKKYIKDWPEEQ